MTVTSAQTGQGMTFSIGDGFDGGSTTYTKVAEVTNITTPKLSRETEDGTHLESPDDHREYLVGLLNSDPATIQVNYLPTEIDALRAAVIAGKGDFRITNRNGVTMTFSGVATGWKPGDGTNGKMTGEFTVQPSGLPTLAAAA
jgi:hypothetical protein